MDLYSLLVSLISPALAVLCCAVLLPHHFLSVLVTSLSLVADISERSVSVFVAKFTDY